ncbi:unknown protein [Oryza sativa Japonica Group]|uniref:Os01g0520800 protein n=2 Tax=Oryza sativa subsp. japonica TaxID=39947 RepID=A0A0P0V3I4_ORYSJ|nr:hypothetical protein OsJ_02023 [Oryza sativa Japonica Group]KAB8081669.1 hypothetical protein EE612_003090 [Oryza sativa]BAD73598.1 unknown protein [Oryza sativa Japonica Group]BAF05122.1 Os01g0520800 [Oryza sativa Japonica Group]BAG95563.1 unnamed protein product [Oryza sativa Japonica Group]|eukprot:NP_001043208.1 Os01g0520800 [Oryza sativa Japonica Group]
MAATARSIDHASNPKTDAVARHTTDAVACRLLRGSSHSLEVARLWHHRSPPHILFAAPSSPSITRSEKTSIRSMYRCLQVFNGTNDYPTRRPVDYPLEEQQTDEHRLEDQGDIHVHKHWTKWRQDSKESREQAMKE